MKDPASSTHIKQARLAARSNMKLSLIVAAAALLSLAFKVRYYEHYVKPLLWLAAFFFFIGILEFAGLEWLKNRDKHQTPYSKDDATDATKVDFVPNEESISHTHRGETLGRQCGMRTNTPFGT